MAATWLPRCSTWEALGSKLSGDKKSGLVLRESEVGKDARAASQTPTYGRTGVGVRVAGCPQHSGHGYCPTRGFSTWTPTRWDCLSCCHSEHLTQAYPTALHTGAVGLNGFFTGHNSNYSSTSCLAPGRREQNSERWQGQGLLHGLRGPGRPEPQVASQAPGEGESPPLQTVRGSRPLRASLPCSRHYRADKSSAPEHRGIRILRGITKRLQEKQGHLLPRVTAPGPAEAAGRLNDTESKH